MYSKNSCTMNNKGSLTNSKSWYITKARQIVLILLGTFIYSIGVNIFIVPNKFLSGGVAGIALLVQYITKIPSGYLVFFINLPIFILGMKIINKEFCFLSLIGMLSMSFFLVLTDKFDTIFIVDDLLIASICGGVLCGLGMAIVFLNKASEGGTDIIAIILKNKYGIKLSSMSFILNAIIVGIGLILNDLIITIYTLISLFIRAYILEKTLDLINNKKLLIVISNSPDTVKDSIVKSLGRGVTFLHGEGAFTGDQKKIIYSIMDAKQLEKAKTLIKEIDNSAVITVMNVTEAHGKGFRELSF